MQEAEAKQWLDSHLEDAPPMYTQKVSYQLIGLTDEAEATLRANGFNEEQVFAYTVPKLGFDRLRHVKIKMLVAHKQNA